MNADRQLIVNADDFGYSQGINRGIIHAHEQGVVTSASLMVRWPGAAEAAAYARENPRLSVGLHLDFGEWYSHHGQTWARYIVVPPDAGSAEFEAEIWRQFATFRVLMGREPSHLDSHQHVHLRKSLRPLMQRLSRERRLPVRGIAPDIRYCGVFHGRGANGRLRPERLTVLALRTILNKQPPGITELGCHPAREIDFESTYAAERIEECATLCDGAVSRALREQGIRLISFHDVSV